MTWTGPPIKAIKFSLEVFETSLNKALDSHHVSEAIDQRVAVVRPQHHKAPRVTAVLEDFSSESWDQLERLIDEQWNLFLRHMDVHIEVKCTVAVEKAGSASNKRPRSLAPVEEISSPSSPSAHRNRKTRTNAQVEALMARSERREAQGNIAKDIIEKWRCHGGSCSNINNYC